MARWHKAAFAGIIGATICLGALTWVRAKETSFQKAELESQTRIVASGFATRLRSSLEKHLLALEQMASFFENSEDVTEEEFHSFAAQTLKRTPLCLRLSAVDSSLRVHFVHPLEPNRSFIGYDLKTHALAYETLKRAIATKESALSPPLQLVKGEEGFIMATPIFRDNRFLGMVVSSFRTADFFASMVHREVLERYAEIVADSGMALFKSDSFREQGSAVEPVSEQFSLAGRVWEIRVKPRDDVDLGHQRAGRAVFWIMGWLLVLGAGSLSGAATFWASGISTRFRSQAAALQDTRQQLDGAMQQLIQAEKLSALGELVAGVAHEINNPLTTIMGYSQLLLAQDPDPEVKGLLEIMLSEADRMARIVRNLLTFARKHPPEKKHVGLNEIIERTLELKAYHFRVSQIEVEKDLFPDLPKTMLDFHQIQQVLINLLNNAEQAMAESGRRGSIRVATRVLGDRIEARISDSGPGIPPEIRERVFEPFFTTKKEGKGTGLGLSLCYGIIQEHGGTIRAESMRGNGSTFVIELPVIAPDGEAAEEAPPVSTTVRPLMILVIDDEPGIQAFLVDLLRSRGHKVDTASDVPEALAKIATNGHDLIISDMKMPHGSGRDIFKAAMDKSPRLARRIVFTTGDGASPETRRFLEETGNEVVTKPYKIEQIEAAIANAMKT